MIVQTPNWTEEVWWPIALPTIRTITVNVPEQDGKVVYPSTVPFGFRAPDSDSLGECAWTLRTDNTR